ncbi:MAG: hypothetical protein IH921_08740 [Gemmatimonadetes bacterium]|nr:hypothetical protein [Gemmatimonadota bacterium]
MNTLRAMWVLTFLAWPVPGAAQSLLVPMDRVQENHLKAYGVAFWVLQRAVNIDWLLNYRGGSFLIESFPELEQELAIRGVYFERLNGAQTARVIAEVEKESSNTAVVRLEKPPRIAVYAPKQTLPWDDAVLLALTYAEVPYEMVYDDDVLDGKLADYDWLHLHHEDFTGQFGKFYQYRNMSWYIEQQRQAEETAQRHGFRKVSQLKLAVAQTIRAYVFQGGFLFAMCSGTDTFDIAMAAHNTDIVPGEYDGDPVDQDALPPLLDDPAKPMVNHAIAEVHPPGSTFKQVTGTAALQATAGALDGTYLATVTAADGDGLEPNHSGTFEATERFVYHTDGLGSVTELTDSTGVVARAYAYDAYGQIADEIGTLANPYAYTGREFDAESGLYFYRARYYDPETGRFISEDPLGFGGGDANLFRYVFNNPVNLVDPSGYGFLKLK